MNIYDKLQTLSEKAKQALAEDYTDRGSDIEDIAIELKATAEAGLFQEAAAVIAEFIADIDAVGVESLREEGCGSDAGDDGTWPDLAATYDKAKILMGEKWKT